LRAIGAIFWTSTGLDAQERAALNGFGIVVAAVDRLRLKQQLGKRQAIELFYPLGAPVMTDI
jgi:hypothetical protein